MSPHMLKRLFPNASASCLAANQADYGSGVPDEKAPACAKDGPKTAREPENGEVAPVGPARRYKVVFEVPPKELSPNGSRTHWGTRCRIVKRTRDAAMLAALKLIPDGRQPRIKQASMQLRWFHATARRLDPDNAIARAKQLCDGIVDSGLVYNDKELTWLPVQQFTDKANPRVEIEVVEIL